MQQDYFSAKELTLSCCYLHKEQKSNKEKFQSGQNEVFFLPITITQYHYFIIILISAKLFLLC